MDFSLILKKINNTLSQEEEILFNRWYDDSADHRAFYEKVKWQQEVSITEDEINADWDAISTKINGGKQRRSYWKYAIAAAIGAIFLVTFINRDVTSKEKYAVQESSILIGSDKASLTLEDGSEIALENGNTYTAVDFKSDGKHLIYASKEEEDHQLHYNFLATPSGGQYQLELSDGTLIWLNSNSQIKYPIAFKKGETREVELLYGEAYFDVTPSTDNDGAIFAVTTKSQRIEVLGTEFNVKAYRDENNVITTLVEGEVVLLQDEEIKQRLLPGDQTILDLNTGTIAKEINNDLEEMTAWKNGQFIFNKEPLFEIMKTLSRWYTIEVDFTNQEKKDVQFSGVLDRNKHVFDLLKNFESTGEVSFEFNENKISIN